MKCECLATNQFHLINQVLRIEFFRLSYELSSHQSHRSTTLTVPLIETGDTYIEHVILEVFVQTTPTLQNLVITARSTNLFSLKIINLNYKFIQCTTMEGIYLPIYGHQPMMMHPGILPLSQRRPTGQQCCLQSNNFS